MRNNRIHEAFADQMDRQFHRDPAIAAVVEAIRNDGDVEAAAQHFVDEWSRHPVRRKSARYGLALLALAHRPENVDRRSEFSALIRRVHGQHVDDWSWQYREALASK